LLGLYLTVDDVDLERMTTWLGHEYDFHDSTVPTRPMSAIKPCRAAHYSDHIQTRIRKASEREKSERCFERIS